MSNATPTSAPHSQDQPPGRNTLVAMTPALRDQLQALSQPNPWRWGALVALDWGLIALAMALAQRSGFNPAAVLLAVLVIGNRQHALFAMGHEGGHGTASAQPWLNDSLTSLLCFAPLGIPLGGYRRFHFAHHRLCGTPADPEHAHTRRFQEWGLPWRGPQQLGFIVKSLLGYSLVQLAHVAQLTRPQSARDALLGPGLWWATALAVLWWTGAWWVLALWLGSTLTSMWLFFRLRTWLEHVGTTGTHRVHVNWLRRQLYAPHRTDLHWEHHVWPSVPAWHLQRARQLLPEPRIWSLAELQQFYRTAAPLASGEFFRPGH